MAKPSFHVRKSTDRGYASHGWLKSFHSFSFADYHDKNFMGFRSLRVINEDYIDAGMGFGKHPHRDMEIITYVVSGTLEHQDSMGNKEIIKPGEVQYMTAGTGVMHSEYNPSKTEPTHLLQIWILPNRSGGAPGYGQKSFDIQLQSGKRVLVVSPEGREGSIAIKQDADIYVARPLEGLQEGFQLRPNRGAWIQVVKGEIKVHSQKLSAGDAIAIEGEPNFAIEAIVDSEYILFDLG